MKKLCKHTVRSKSRGSVTLELKWFQKDCEHLGLTNTCFECLEEARVQKSREFYKEFQVSRVSVSIPTPSSYEELQQKIALKAPSAFGIATVERPDGSQVLPKETFKNGEVIIVREICPLRDFENNCGVALQQWCGQKSASWETDIYKKVCNEYVK